jgi:hypothetical protein
MICKAVRLHPVTRYTKTDIPQLEWSNIGLSLMPTQLTKANEISINNSKYDVRLLPLQFRIISCLFSIFLIDCGPDLSLKGFLCRRCGGCGEAAPRQSQRTVYTVYEDHVLSQRNFLYPDLSDD